MGELVKTNYTDLNIDMGFIGRTELNVVLFEIYSVLKAYLYARSIFCYETFMNKEHSSLDLIFSTISVRMCTWHAGHYEREKPPCPITTSAFVPQNPLTY
jgi:hypothetical protein